MTNFEFCKTRENALAEFGLIHKDKSPFDCDFSIMFLDWLYSEHEDTVDSECDSFQCYDVTFRTEELVNETVGVMAKNPSAACRVAEKSLKEGKHLDNLQFVRCTAVEKI